MLVSSQRWSGWCFVAVLLVVVVAGVLGRSAYLGRGYFAPDEEVALGVVGCLNFPERWDTSWEHAAVQRVYRYPQYNFSSYHYALYSWGRVFSGWRAGTVDLATGRTLNAVFGAIAILASAVAARRMGGDSAGIAAAVLVAFSPLLIQDAHYLRCEAMLTAGCAVVLWLLLAPERLTILRVFGGGAILGWLIASKPPVGLVLASAVLLVWQTAGSRKMGGRMIFGALVVLLVGTTLGFVAGVPFGVLRPDAYIVGQLVLQKQYAAPLPPFTSPDLAPTWAAAVLYFLRSLGTGVSAVAISGVWFQWRRGRVVCAALVFPLLAAWGLFGAHPLFSERSYSPLFPLGAVLFGVGIAGLVPLLIAWSGRVLRGLGPMAVAGALAWVLWTPLHLSWLLVWRGFSGREAIAQSEFLEVMRTRYPDADLVVTGVAKAGEVERIVQLAEGRRPLLVAVCDYYDGNTQEGVRRLQRMAASELVAVREGIFVGFPPCSLQAFISPRTLVYLYR